VTASPLAFKHRELIGQGGVTEKVYKLGCGPLKRDLPPPVHFKELQGCDPSSYYS
jgi:hypothetical protein